MAKAEWVNSSSTLTEYSLALVSCTTHYEVFWVSRIFFHCSVPSVHSVGRLALGSRQEKTSGGTRKRILAYSGPNTHLLSHFCFRFLSLCVAEVSTCAMSREPVCWLRKVGMLHASNEETDGPSNGCCSYAVFHLV